MQTRKSIDTEQLSTEDSAHLKRLLEQARFFELPPSIERPALRDAFQYVISVDTGDKKHSVSITGEPQDPSLKELKRKLEKIST